MASFADTHSEPTNYKKKYKALKRKLRFLIYVSTFSQHLLLIDVIFNVFGNFTFIQMWTEFEEPLNILDNNFQEQECFLEELRKSQRKLLRVSRDKR